VSARSVCVKENQRGWDCKRVVLSPNCAETVQNEEAVTGSFCCVGIPFSTDGALLGSSAVFSGAVSQPPPDRDLTPER